MKSKIEKIKNFDPSGVGEINGRFIGLPFEESEAAIVIIPVPWDATVSFQEGTASAPNNVLTASYQLDLYDEAVPDAWKMGHYMQPPDEELAALNQATRKQAVACIDLLEAGKAIEEKEQISKLREAVNCACRQMNDKVYAMTKRSLEQGKQVALLGGDHSTPLGFIKALSEKNPGFSILQIDAHMDLRKAYEGFEFSHASIFFNALKFGGVANLVQVGIRDFCQEEMDFCEQHKNRVHVVTDRQMKEDVFTGKTYDAICKNIVEKLAENVYLSFDIDGLEPSLCPNTGTPVPGGLRFQEALFLVESVVRSGRKIIGFDLCEVAGEPHAHDGNTGARLLYKICNLMGKSANLG